MIYKGVRLKAFAFCLCGLLWAPIAKAEHLPSSAVVILLNESSFERDIFYPAAKAILYNYERSKIIMAPIDWRHYSYDKRESVLSAPLQEFLSQTKDGPVDIFVFGHTNSVQKWLLNKISKSLRQKIRLLYDSGCTDGKEAELRAMKTQGIGVAIGHPNESYSWAFLPEFMPLWLKGYSVGEAITIANQRMKSSWLAYTLTWGDIKGLEDSHASAVGDLNMTFNQKY